ncbi:MAG: nuclear transport factor 2 family protein [Alkalicoccus sp.]|nr:MAG: nuclear transport factor 2 family protein [Alkalicoccus sp.]
MRTKEVIQAFNEAFSANDISFMADNMAENVVWEVKGETIIRGKQAVLNYLNDRGGEGIFNLTVENLLSEGTAAACSGVRHMKNNDKIQDFCDIYRLDEQNGLIEKVISFSAER